MKYPVFSMFLLLVFTQQALAADPSLDTNEKKFSYTIGFQMGQGLRQQGLEVDADAMIQAIRDVLDGAPLKLSLEEMQTASRAYRAEEEEKRKVIADKNKKDGETFLAENAKKKGVKTTPSGLQYIVLNEGTGKHPSLNDNVSVNYRGTFINGQEFDSSYKRGQPASFNASGVIKGWQETLPLMKVGAKWKVFIPPELAYGAQGNSAIPPNETLIFEIELLSIN